MTTKELIDKYTDLTRRSNKQAEAYHEDLKNARMVKNQKNAGPEDLEDYECAKIAYLSERRVGQIYGEICHDLGDTE